ncbi:predicted protein, partial [Nematostella vectensis]
NECLNNPCAHGGSCTNAAGDYSCACIQGWTGKNCDQDADECALKPCAYGGSCV